MKTVFISSCHGKVVKSYKVEAEEASGRCPVCDIMIDLDRVCESCDADIPIGSIIKKCWHCGE